LLEHLCLLVFPSLVLANVMGQACLAADSSGSKVENLEALTGTDGVAPGAENAGEAKTVEATSSDIVFDSKASMEVHASSSMDPMDSMASMEVHPSSSMAVNPSSSVMSSLSDEEPEPTPAPTAGCVMTFEEDGKPIDITLTQSPLGMTYLTDVYPIVITKLKAGSSHAQAAGVKVGMKLTKIDGEDMLNMDYAKADTLIKAAAKKLAA